MITAKISGNITQIGEILTLKDSARKVQKIQVTTIPLPDALGRFTEKENIFDVFIYGNDILKVWQQHNDKLPTPTVNIDAQLVGRLKYDKAGTPYNNITLRLINIKFNYSL
jgi:hypothetical protein